jgi:hypothetical protein
MRSSANQNRTSAPSQPADVTNTISKLNPALPLTHMTGIPLFDFKFAGFPFAYHALMQDTRLNRQFRPSAGHTKEVLP